MLTPPPVAPPRPLTRSPLPPCHTTSVNFLYLRVFMVPPTARTNGLELGKSTCAPLVFCMSPEPSSPAAQATVISRAAATFSRALRAFRAAFDQPLESSAAPQLIDKAAGFSLIT